MAFIVERIIETRYNNLSKEYTIIGRFKYNGNNMLVVRKDGAACVMSEIEYNRIIEAERKYLRWK